MTVHDRRATLTLTLTLPLTLTRAMTDRCLVHFFLCGTPFFRLVLLIFYLIYLGISFT